MGRDALVIGGTGMLAGTVLWLVEQGYRVTVLARDRRKFEQMRQDMPDPQAVRFIQLDYHQTTELKSAMEELVAETGPIDLVVSWIHSSAPLALETILDVLSRSRSHGDCFRFVEAVPGKILRKKLRGRTLRIVVSFSDLSWRKSRLDGCTITKSHKASSMRFARISRFLS